MTDTSSSGLSGAYRAVWRWHFYAGLFVLPVMMLMALTGGLYLFKAEIEGAVYGRLAHVVPRAERVSPDRWVGAAEARARGEAASVFVPAPPDQAVQVTVRTGQGDRTVFVDPHDGRVRGSIKGEGIMGTVKRLHSLTLLGRPFNILVEIVAGWAVILVATGVFLWWPRKRDVAVTVPRAGDPKRRPFWRDVHAVTGLYAGAVIAFLAVTGMPWSAVWGDQILNVMRESGLGRPPAPAASSWSHAGPHEEPGGTGWTMEHAVLHAPGYGEARLATVVAAVEAAGLPKPWTITIPADRTLAWTAARATERAGEARILYVDGRTGEVRADVRWEQFGAGAKVFEWGIAVHQGQQYGWANRIVMLLGCIAVWVLAISGMVMWWKRRPRRVGLGAPPAPPGPRARAAVLGIVLPLAILYPLTGLSLLAAIALDRLGAAVFRRRGAAG
ncbi:putative iron-regulated membrane protein [Brevundimonas alba]|uniref:Putative iron-regulated membrane protein n=1 Tax=Brevundimonas alba TaxID=74314 RepID=A0A7X6BN91_9CAUL|nr:PepSY domain-containing protein [Brevundimonas alba]NJC41918.1 putative iron-regulated membrane protein [Brevundimonas alba]